MKFESWIGLGSREKVEVNEKIISGFYLFLFFFFYFYLVLGNIFEFDLCSVSREDKRRRRNYDDGDDKLSCGSSAEFRVVESFSSPFQVPNGDDEGKDDERRRRLGRRREF